MFAMTMMMMMMVRNDGVSENHLYLFFFTFIQFRPLLQRAIVLYCQSTRMVGLVGVSLFFVLLEKTFLSVRHGYDLLDGGEQKHWHE